MILKKYSLLSFLFVCFYIFGFISQRIIISIKIEKEKINDLNIKLSNFIANAPDFEDFILYYLFHDIHRGFYIDVGANDPYYYSVTKGFYDRGWNGINVEPLPEKHRLLQKFRKRDINLKLGAGNFEGETSLLISGMKGFDDTSTVSFKGIKNTSKIMKIRIKTMANICKMYVPKGIQIQFCKIDVESSEKNVLLGYDFINYRPKVFCIESLFNTTSKTGEYKEWEYILLLNDYEFGYKYQRNRFYYDKRINGLKKKFFLIDHYIKAFRKYSDFARY